MCRRFSGDGCKLGHGSRSVKYGFSYRDTEARIHRMIKRCRAVSRVTCCCATCACDVWTRSTCVHDRECIYTATHGYIMPSRIHVTLCPCETGTPGYGTLSLCVARLELLQPHIRETFSRCDFWLYKRDSAVPRSTATLLCDPGGGRLRVNCPSFRRRSRRTVSLSFCDAGCAL